MMAVTVVFSGMFVPVMAMPTVRVAAWVVVRLMFVALLPTGAKKLCCEMVLVAALLRVMYSGRSSCRAR